MYEFFDKQIHSTEGNQIQRKELNKNETQQNSSPTFVFFWSQSLHFFFVLQAFERERTIRTQTHSSPSSRDYAGLDVLVTYGINVLCEYFSIIDRF